MVDLAPSPENDYQATPTQTFSRDVWNAVMVSIAGRLKARELLEATFEALIADGTQGALDLISVNVAPYLSDLSVQITALRAQVEAMLDSGAAPDAMKLGGHSPDYYLALAHATGALPVAQVSGVDEVISAAIAALVDSSPDTLDTLKELADALGDDPNFAATMAASLANRLRVDTDAQALNGTQKGNALTNLGATATGKALLAAADMAAGRNALGLGTAATKDVGTGNNNVVQLDASAHMPAALLAVKADAEAGIDAYKLMTPARVADAISALSGGLPPLIATATATTAVSSIDMTIPTPSKWKELVVTITGLQPASVSHTRIAFSEDALSTFRSVYSFNSNTSVNYAREITEVSLKRENIVARVLNLPSAVRPLVMWSGADGGQPVSALISYGAAPVNAIRISMSSGNIAGNTSNCTVRVYGAT